jgi:hypothetical protein
VSSEGRSGADAARQRVATTLGRAERVELGRVVFGAAPAEVVDARRRALEAAAEAGRASLVEEARDAAGAFVTRAFAGQSFTGTWAVTEMAVSVARPTDRAAVAEALADAVTADVVEDLVDVDTIDPLRARMALIEASSAIPDTSSISNITASFVERSTRRGTRVAMLAAVLLLVIGTVLLLTTQLLGIALLAAGLAIVWNVLRS